jgi:PAS domain S-box-containing protein
MLERRRSASGSNPSEIAPELVTPPESLAARLNRILFRHIDRRQLPVRRIHPSGRRTGDEYQWLSAIVESSDDAIIGKTLEGIVTSWNRGAERLYGYSTEEILGRSMNVLMPPDRPNELDEILAQIRRDEHVEAYETLRRRKDGSLVQVAVRISPVRDRTGRIVGASSIARDVTARQQAEEALRESEERFRTLADNISQLVWMADRDGSVFWYNQRWYEYTGATSEQTQGWGWQQVVHPAHAGRVLEKIRLCHQGGRPWEDTFLMQGKDGEYRWFLSRSVPIRDAHGEVVRWFGTSTDISEQRQAEQALIRSEKLASVGRMAATIAHEINNPLASAINTLYLLRTDPQFPAALRGSVHLAEKELARVAHVTRQTLGFYREVGTTGAIDLVETIENILDLYGPKLRNKNITVQRRFRYLEAVRAVEDEVRQIASNVIANSIDALAQNGTLRIAICGPQTLRNSRRMARITIADNGEGISPENMRHILEPFFTTKRAVGTGLGLWVTSELVKKNEGRLRIKSRRSHGTVVAVWLPIERRGRERRAP